MASERGIDSDDRIMRDVGFVLGVIGIAALAFVAGQATADECSDCQEQLTLRTNELILCGMRGGTLPPPPLF